LEKLIPVYAPNQAPGVIVGSDISGILGKNIAYNLVDGVISLLAQSVIYLRQNLPHLLLFIFMDGK